MKKSRFTEGQIVRILKEQESGRNTADICREYGIRQATFYNWRTWDPPQEIRSDGCHPVKEAKGAESGKPAPKVDVCGFKFRP